MLLSALGLWDQVTGMKSRLTSFHPKVQLCKQLLIWLNLFHGIALVKPQDGASGEGLCTYIHLLVLPPERGTLNSSLKPPLQFNPVQQGLVQRNLISETLSRATHKLYRLTGWEIKIGQKNTNLLTHLLPKVLNPRLVLHGQFFLITKSCVCFCMVAAFCSMLSPMTALQFSEI